MSKLTLCRGLPGSGKSTWAREQIAAAEPGTIVAVSRDLLGRMLHGGRPHSQSTERQITCAQHALVAELLRSGTDVIVDDTNLRMHTLKALANVGWRCNAEVTVRDFDSAVEECIARDAQREHQVGEDTLRRMARRYGVDRGKARPPLPPPVEAAKGLPYVPNEDLPQAVIVDIDGTVALHGERDPYDTSRYHEDLPNRPVIAAVRAMYKTGYEVIYCSGRHQDFRDVTEKWIAENVAIPGPLFMRPGPGRDDVVKLALFDQHIRDRWNVVAAFDDRDRVVRMYRDVLGIPVFQVADGAF
jgi:predicted kinase